MEQEVEQLLRETMKANLKKEEAYRRALAADHEVMRIANARQRGLTAYWPDFFEVVSKAATAVNNIIAGDEPVYLVEVEDQGLREDYRILDVFLSRDKKILDSVRLSFSVDHDGTATTTFYSGQQSQTLGNQPLNVFQASQPIIEIYIAEFFRLYVDGRPD